MENRQRVVVTGMGVISPIGNDVPTFWNNIQHGVSGIGPLTKCDTAGLDSRVSAEVKGFDPKNYFEVKEAKRMALFTQYAVAAAKEAWRDAGFEGPSAIPERTAVILGNGIGGREVDHDAHKTLFEKGAQRISPMAIPKLIINEAAGNISMTLNAKAPVLTIVTACASGTDAIGVALDAIRSGRADVVITGGTEAAITQVAIGGFCALGALSTKYNDTPGKACRPFDLNRDGFVIGEGSVILVLEELEHARRRGAHIYAEVLGQAATADAFHIAAPDPAGSGPARTMRWALADAGVAPEQVDYINAHGSATQPNDTAETAAIKQVFGEHAYDLSISSTKSMIGHLFGAAGAVEGLATVMAVHNDTIHPTINYETPDPACDLDYTPNVARRRPVQVALSNSFGLGGQNACVVFGKWLNGKA